ncbi:L-aspartate dehydrogenase [Brucella sp. NBRC 13694]|uniref:aspartate dehydrogenase domain-containing protein n=1 Tax=Brucella/Ochrobactrum group TaxID=2826938 RepID=UPI00247848F1|nr:aspartate dehydrogenase domain-containing protein [Brucella anthropi]MDH7785763.1 aspartate dehydrogenase [Ochrobactrum sp. 19YEA23]
MAQQFQSGPISSEFSQSFTIGLIGFGAIARELLVNFAHEGVAWVVYTRASSRVHDAAQNITFVHHLHELINSKPCVVIEAAGQTALTDYVPVIFEAGIPVIAASVGALADEKFLLTLTQAHRNTAASLIFPSGAVGGLDYLSAIAPLEDARIRYTSRKPPAAWKAELQERELVCETDPVVLFEGSPAEAARLYPQNLNAALALSLAIRPRALAVRVLADPKAKGNTHEIEAESAAGTAFMRFENVPSPFNPKTSAITALSLASTLRKFLHLDGMS